MAKWGEGDPRWIVEERPDATNVNNWHWTEKNADSWSKGKLESLFKGLRVEEPSLGVATITEIESLEGEARVNNRKSKLISSTSGSSS
ncbi:Activator of 90 kDa heat shock protein ATPase -like protein 1 [Caligus rogercresseyi]|uniref:Activator of 90 kDa heat shock protein ATPase -like protein 1 n=1 Tax=Caligus rogercresseyi TaxID=217165 RepID=A0A7T8KLE7_CALRO|nr:Activator of 90 kDa heat shock protein ATPase -like protein 1 [Caligus rogercresseyi]